MAKKKLKWYKVYSPKVFGSKEVGETKSDDPKKVMGRVLTINARDLTGDYKKSHINIKLKINKLEDDKAFTEVYGYQVSRQHLQRFIHKNSSKIDVIQDLETNDKKKIRVKCVATTIRRVQSTKKKLIRNKLIKELKKIINNMTLDNLIFISTTNKIQKTINNRLKKTYPLKFVEIKRIDLFNQGVVKPQQANS